MSILEGDNDTKIEIEGADDVELLPVAGLAVLCLYAWHYGHIIVGVVALVAGGLYVVALLAGGASLPGTNVVPYIIAGGIFAWVWSVT